MYRHRVRASAIHGVVGCPLTVYGELTPHRAGVDSGGMTGTTAEGKKVEVNGCDVFTFEGDKIALKSSYFKTRT